MKLTIHRDDLAAAVTWAARAVPQRPTTPILAGVLITADNDKVTVSGFDYDTSADATTSADVAEPGRALVSGRLLAHVVAALPAKPVEVALTGTELELRCGGAEFALNTLPVEDYPTLPQPPAPLGQVDAAALRTALAQVTPAASPDETLIMLTGVRIDIDEHGLEMAATDRYRIAARRIDWQPTTDSPAVGVVVPAKTLRDVGKHLHDGPVAVGADDALFSLTSGGRRMVTRLLDTEFVKYRNSFALLNAPHLARVDAAPLIEAIKRVTLVADKNTPVRLAFTGEQVEVSAGGGDLGRGNEAVPCTLDGTDEVAVSFMPQFILDGLAGVPGDVATISMLEPHKPVLVTGDDDPTYRYVAMSLRQA
ncbi:DNA polymerase III subunit beta [Nonomuraea sp. NPDC023979]|uniref:DNA polymerase III subunit beta n=1 Tax=Nonomuraea sp. NPDC023979 TaxID=3154796 RepID=UPI00340F9465